MEFNPAPKYKVCSISECNKKVKSKGLCEMHYYRLRRNGNIYYKKSNGKHLDYRIDENDCFVVISHTKLSNGYHLVHYNHRRKSAHRLVYEEMFGEIPKGLVVRHKCDNRSCINPEHLELGTHLDNSQDMVKRDRSKKGEQHPRSKITEKDALAIKKLAYSGMKRKDICEMYGLKNINHITDIKYGRCWKHLEQR